jgi:hypothetical protein
LPAAVNLTPKVAEETVCEIMVPVQHLTKNMWQEALRGASAAAGFRELLSLVRQLPNFDIQTNVYGHLSMDGKNLTRESLA